MLLGRMPGDTVPALSNLFAVLPSYGTLTGGYLDRFGPYRLQPYAAPRPPLAGAPAPLPMAPSLPVAAVTAARATRTSDGARGHDARTIGGAVDPVGTGPGALTGYDRAIALGDAFADPLGLGFGFSNPGLIGLAGLAVREIAKAARRDTVSKINEARMKGLVNDANRRPAPGAPIGRAGGVGTPGVGGGFTKEPGSRPSRSSDRPGKDGSPSRGGIGRDSRSFGH